jgi:septum site-determining protein MinC
MAAGNLVQGALFTVMVVRASMLSDPAFEEELARQIERSPRFFLNAPVVLDLKDVDDFTTGGEFDEAKELLREQTLTLVGVQNALPTQIEAAAEAGLASFAPTSAQPSGRRAVAAAQAAAASAAASASASTPDPMPPPPPLRATSVKTKLVTQPVRSGTQIYARGSDLVITAPVSAGAEVIADGNIHIYSVLRGRALAGASGDTEARIFCSRLEAELVSIGGRYLVSEQLPADRRNVPVQIALVDDELTITRN